MRRWQLTITRYATYPVEGGDVDQLFDTWAEARDAAVADLRRFEHDAAAGLAYVVPHFVDQLLALNDGDPWHSTTACGAYSLGDEQRPDGAFVYPAGEPRELVGPVSWRTGRRDPPTVTVDPACWARGPWQALAVTLAEPLRRAYRDHVTQHRCSPASCDEARRLYRLQPWGDRPPPIAIA